MRFDFVPPAPTYPEYEDLRAQAAVIASRPVDPRGIPARHRLTARYDWCLAVLGKPCHGLGSISSVDAELLVLADAAGLDPPLPQWVVDERQQAAEWQAAIDERRRVQREKEAAAWAAAREGCPVELEVRLNTTSRVRGDVKDQLGHAVPVAAAVSGTSRKHLAGRALCETPGRKRPLLLSEPIEGGVVSCVRCLDYTPKIRPAAL